MSKAKDTDLKERDNEVCISKARRMIALEAVWEIEALCGVLRTAVEPTADGEYLVVRGLAMRIKALSGAAMSAISDESEPTTLLAVRVGVDLDETDLAGGAT